MSGLGNWRDIPRMMYHLEYALGKEDKVRNWECEYCGRANFPEKLDCRKCGAPKPDGAPQPWGHPGYVQPDPYKCNMSGTGAVYTTLTTCGDWVNY